MDHIRHRYNSYKVLCDGFAMSLLEFKEIFKLGDALFLVLDTDNNGLVDMLEIFSSLALLSESRVEDKLRCRNGMTQFCFKSTTSMSPGNWTLRNLNFCCGAQLKD